MVNKYIVFYMKMSCHIWGCDQSQMCTVDMSRMGQTSQCSKVSNVYLIPLKMSGLF